MTIRIGAAFSILLALVASGCVSVDIQPGSGGGSSGGATSGLTGGSSTAGATAGATAGQACLVGKTSQQLDSCADAGGCGCPLQCARDPLSTPIDGQGRVCEAACQADSSCNILTACVGGVCSLIACGADAGNGTYAFTCAMGEGLGSCDVGEIDGGRFSLCVAGGTSDGTCDTVNANRSMSSGLCLPGYFCFGPPDGGQGTCEQLCDDVTALCPAGQSCLLELKSPNYGHCIP